MAKTHLSNQTLAIEFMIGKITHRIVKQHAVNEDDPPDEVTFLLVRIHVSHRRFYGSRCDGSSTTRVRLTGKFHFGEF